MSLYELTRTVEGHPRPGAARGRGGWRAAGVGGHSGVRGCAPGPRAPSPASAPQHLVEHLFALLAAEHHAAARERLSPHHPDPPAAAVFAVLSGSLGGAVQLRARACLRCLHESWSAPRCWWPQRQRLKEDL